MTRISLSTSAVLSLLLLFSASQIPRASASQENFSVPGLWSGTVYYGDPANPATPKEQFLSTVRADGTYSVDSTAATGSHPLNPGAKTEERGAWERQGRGVTTHGFWFDEGGAGAGFSVGRGVTALEFVSADQLAGYADIDFLPCPAGPLGCPDPVDTGALVLGTGLGPFPVVLRRIR
jgi:hypothetical protein